tara:strand:+ start:296 stop:574 length:279 start_codon:yes stop_codon:yes gene_type:complete
MKHRVTEAQLQAVAARINRITGSPLTSYAVNAEGKHVPQPGNYHISHAYGGVCLHRMHNEGGGVSSPLSTGHIPKRELLSLMFAFIEGLSSK